MNIPHLVFVGADKGGVGKTMLSRALLGYYGANGIDFRAFDTQSPSGGLQRFFPGRAQIVDITKSTDQVKVFDDLASTQVTVVDVCAGLLSPTLKTLDVVGFFDAAKQNKLRITVLHVVGPATQSLDEIKPVMAALAGSKHVVLANHIDDTAYDVPAGALNIPRLDGEAAKAVDAVAQPFHDFIGSQASFVLRGYTRSWLKDVFAQFDAAQLNNLA
ncbi:hypothetical protein JQ593_22775 [Bradyrhizobium viridifuturi]|jgi:hypothetical protein|nr:MULTISPECIES: hypothetical protein [Bacteria]MBR1038912.1 hypothetical protein [Bradyrhizobium viridifuturi]MCA3704568.1 hypothetical protein [Methylobacterium sp.]OYU64058.1 MAG: hypothetical protein CFE30_00120 [Bradyrhizobium sp. PARBB1]PCL38352.1 hypothetical protein CPZ11_15595 [Lacticaseibacillus rhamnosus]RAV92131.1 hypothetical protein DBT46_11330 [Aerococcus mictus]RRB83230.1 hypothetical protein EIA23_26075 [Escherichia coli]DAR98568.1 MAG TPA: TraL [Caudoviricetes sp.]HBD96904